MKLSSNVVGDYKDEKKFPINCYRLIHKFRYLSKCAKVSSTTIKSLKTRLHKIGQSGGFLGRLLWPLLKTDFPLMKNVLKPLAESVLVPLALTAAILAKKDFGSAMSTFIVSNEEMNGIMKIVTSLKDYGFWQKKAFKHN